MRKRFRQAWRDAGDGTEWVAVLIIVVVIAAMWAIIMLGVRGVRAFDAALTNASTPEDISKICIVVAIIGGVWFLFALDKIADAIKDVAKELKRQNDRESK